MASAQAQAVLSGRRRFMLLLVLVPVVATSSPLSSSSSSVAPRQLIREFDKVLFMFCTNIGLYYYPIRLPTKHMAKQALPLVYDPKKAQAYTLRWFDNCSKSVGSAYDTLPYEERVAIVGAFWHKVGNIVTNHLAKSSKSTVSGWLNEWDMQFHPLPSTLSPADKALLTQAFESEFMNHCPTRDQFDRILAMTEPTFQVSRSLNNYHHYELMYTLEGKFLWRIFVARMSSFEPLEKNYRRGDNEQAYDHWIVALFFYQNAHFDEQELKHLEAYADTCGLADIIQRLREDDYRTTAQGFFSKLMDEEQKRQQTMLKPLTFVFQHLAYNDYHMLSIIPDDFHQLENDLFSVKFGQVHYSTLAGLMQADYRDFKAVKQQSPSLLEAYYALVKRHALLYIASEYFIQEQAVIVPLMGYQLAATNDDQSSSSSSSVPDSDEPVSSIWTLAGITALSLAQAGFWGWSLYKVIKWALNGNGTLTSHLSSLKNLASTTTTTEPPIGPLGPWWIAAACVIVLVAGAVVAYFGRNRYPMRNILAALGRGEAAGGKKVNEEDAAKSQKGKTSPTTSKEKKEEGGGDGESSQSSSAAKTSPTSKKKMSDGSSSRSSQASATPTAGSSV